MSGDIKQILEQAKLLISKDKERLGLIESENINTHVQLDKCVSNRRMVFRCEALLFINFNKYIRFRVIMLYNVC